MIRLLRSEAEPDFTSCVVWPCFREKQQANWVGKVSRPGSGWPGTGRKRSRVLEGFGRRGSVFPGSRTRVDYYLARAGTHIDSWMFRCRHRFDYAPSGAASSRWNLRKPFGRPAKDGFLRETVPSWSTDRFAPSGLTFGAGAVSSETASTRSRPVELCFSSEK